MRCNLTTATQNTLPLGVRFRHVRQNLSQPPRVGGCLPHAMRRSVKASKSQSVKEPKRQSDQVVHLGTVEMVAATCHAVGVLIGRHMVGIYRHRLQECYNCPSFTCRNLNPPSRGCVSAGVCPQEARFSIFVYHAKGQQVSLLGEEKMIRSILFVSALAAAPFDELPAQEIKLDTVKQQRSYAIGLNVGRSIKGDELDLDLDVLFRGMRDAMTDAEPKLTDAELNRVMMGIERAMQQRAEEKVANNLKEGREFLAQNAKKEGVITLESGLQYKVLKSGNGESPKVTDTVTTHYHGTLIDGTVFDSSVKRNMPATFPVGRVIPGWTEALQKMQVGDKWRLFIPSELAYGKRGAGGVIGPNAALIFEVELLGIED